MSWAPEVAEERPGRPEKPDIEFTADVKARELRFEEVPQTEVRFPGRPERESVSGTERENLPEEVEPGITYRDPRVRLRIATALAGDRPGDSTQAERREGKSDETRRKK